MGYWFIYHVARIPISFVAVDFVWANGVPQLQTRLIDVALRNGMRKVNKL